MTINAKLLKMDGSLNKKYYNSYENQYIKRKFIEKKVIQDITEVVTQLIQVNKKEESLGINIKDYLKYSYKATNGISYTSEQADDKIEELENEIQSLSEDLTESTNSGISWTIQSNIDKRVELLEELQECEFENVSEVFEYHVVSIWLAEKLEELGEIVIYEYNLAIWGRTEQKQSIIKDEVISKICDKLEILQGQKYEQK